MFASIVPTVASSEKTATPSRSLTDSIRLALEPNYRLASILGAVAGGAIPVGVFWLSHHELDLSRPLYFQLKAFFVLFGLMFSALSVFETARVAFRKVPKALGFTVLLEGIMVTADTAWLTYAALAILIFVNAVAAATALADDQRENRARVRRPRAERAAGSKAKTKAKARAKVTRKPKSTPQRQVQLVA